MSVLHHAAYDRNLLGIDPDGKIHIQEVLLAKNGGRVMREALQKLHHQTIREPRNNDGRPNRESLEERFAQFLRAA